MEELLIRLKSCFVLSPEYDEEAAKSLTPNFKKIAILGAIRNSFVSVKFSYYLTFKRVDD